MPGEEKDEQQAGQGQSSDQSAPPAKSGDGDKGEDLAAKLAAIEKERQAEGAELEKLRNEKKQAEDAKLSETERLKKERDEAVAAARRALVQAKSAQLGIVDPEVAATLIPSDTSDDKIEDALKALIEKKPYLKGAPNGLTTPGGNPGRKAGLTLDQVKAMTAAEINKNWDAVQAALAAK